MAPVCMIIFNRPDKAAIILDRVRAYRPKQLFVCADGPRPGEDMNCKAARAVIDNGIDWPCEVTRRYAESNRGVNVGVAEGLTWLFEQTDRSIVLEDDCVPHPSFFPYCAELLERYADDERICHIAGTDMQLNSRRCPPSYYFSFAAHIWGWAGWRRTWKLHDPTCSYWPTVRASNWLDQISNGDAFLKAYFQSVGDVAYSGRCGWDMPYTLGCWIRGQFAVAPTGNLIENTGFDNSGVGCQGIHPIFARVLSEMPTREMRFPMVHPQAVENDFDADHFAIQVHANDWPSVVRTLVKRASEQ